VNPKQVNTLEQAYTPYITFILAILSNQPFNAQFCKLSYIYWLAIPTGFDVQGVILRESTIWLFDLLALQMDILTQFDHLGRM